MVWVNKDGLTVKFATEEAQPGPGGEYGSYDPGSTHLIELVVSPTTTPGTTGTFTLDNVRLPGGTGWGILVEDVKVSTDATLTGDLSIGVSGPTGAVTTAFVAAATTWPAAGADDVAGAGTWVNTVQSGRLKGDVLTYTVNTPVTAGKGLVKIWFKAVQV